jgi:hypothetical protein
MMRTDDDQVETEIDEYLWPLTGDLSPINWEHLSEEMHIRERLAEILAHVREMHVVPRQRQLGPRVAPATIVQAVIAGPENGPPWEQTLKEPVPRALRDEWNQLAARLRTLAGRCDRETSTNR